MQRETFAYSRQKGTRNCATKPPAVLQVWISDSSSPWLIALKSGTPPNKMRSQWPWQSRSARSVSARKETWFCPVKKNTKKTAWSWGQRADRATDLSQMCISETNIFLQHLGRILRYHAPIMGQSQLKRSAWIHKCTCMGVSAKN